MTTDIKTICDKFGIEPSKSRGQNFLIDKNIIGKIIATAGLSKQDTVLEVGPGLGVLTEELLLVAGRVIAVEVDRRILKYLQERFRAEIDDGRLVLVEADILKVNLPALGLADFNFKICANLPYSVTSKFFRLFLEHGPKPVDMTVMIQKEVAQRMTARVGEMSLLALSAQFFSSPKIAFEVPPSCFWPQPEVESAVIRLDLKKELPNIEPRVMFRLARLGFASKRKQLHNNLAAGLGLKSEDVKVVFRGFGWREDIRAQDLGIEDWVELTRVLEKY